MPGRERQPRDAPRLGPADRGEAQLCTFRVGGEDYAIDIMRVREVIPPCPITPVPRAPAFVEGVVKLRGEVVPVLDVRKRLGVRPAPEARRVRFVVVNVAGRRVALVVDEVCEVIRVRREELRPAPALGDERGPRFFVGACGGDPGAAGRRGGAGRLRLLLNVKALLDPSAPGDADAARAQASAARGAAGPSPAGGEPETP